MANATPFPLLLRSMVLGEYIDLPETLRREYKEFTLRNLTMQYEERDLYDALVNTLSPMERGEFKTIDTDEVDQLSAIVYDQTLSSLQCNIGWMLPKYVSCFTNSNLDGELFLGIGDDCEITGIPLVPGLTKEKVYEFLISSLDDFLLIDGQNVKEGGIDWRTIVDIDIVRLESDTRHLNSTDFMNTLRLQQEELMKHNDAMLEYNEERIVWLQKQSVHSSKLIDIVNTTSLRKGLIDFIQNHVGDWVASTRSLVTTLEKNEFIHFNTNYEYFELEKNNKGKIWFWVTKFKEAALQDLATTLYSIWHGVHRIMFSHQGRCTIFQMQECKFPLPE